MAKYCNNDLNAAFLEFFKFGKLVHNAPFNVNPPPRPRNSFEP